MKTPFEEAQAVYLREESNKSFLYDLTMHLENETAYVLKTPTMFCLARPVDRYADEETILDPRFYFPRERWNAWFLALYAGDVSEVLQQVPVALPWFGWQKRNRLRFWSSSGIHRLFSKKHEASPIAQQE